jgi:hypothetical protein
MAARAAKQASLSSDSVIDFIIALFGLCFSYGRARQEKCTARYKNHKQISFQLRLLTRFRVGPELSPFRHSALDVRRSTLGVRLLLPCLSSGRQECLPYNKKAPELTPGLSVLSC